MVIKKQTKPKKPRAKKPKIKWEEVLAEKLVASGLPNPAREYKFHPIRRWRSDLAYPLDMILIEVEGGAFVRGRHVRGYGYRNDCIKYNAAALLGYTVLRFTTDMVKSGVAERVVAEAYSRRKILHGA